MIQEVDIQAALSEFYVRCQLTRIFVGDDYINYKTGGSDYANAYCLDEAERIIKKFNLPLKAEMTGYPIKNILQIKSK